MESTEIRSSVFLKTMRFNGLSQPKLRAFERRNQPKGFIEKSNSGVNGLSRPLHHEKFRAFERQSKSDSGFKVIPTKGLCRVYLHKTELLASKGVIDARAEPPHYQKHGEVAKKRRFGGRFDQQNLNLKSKLRHQTNVSPRRFSPLGFGSDSQLRDSKRKGQYIITPEKKSNEMRKLCDGTTKKDGALREPGSKLSVSTSRDSVLSLERNRFAQDVKFRHVSSSGSTSKDESEDSSDCSTASPGCQTEEAHQPSPVSVLEPMFNDDVLEDDSEELPYLDLHGIEKQLDYLKSESDSYSDGSGMEVSSDEESVIASETEDSEQVRILDSQESKEASYIDDILSEVSLMDKNWVPEKLDSVLTFKVFEKMEKKYYTETSWKRSERRILFDRINSSLVEILESFTSTPTWKKPVSRRLGAGLSTSGLKQELCKVLARQEKRAKKVSFNKVPVIDLDEWVALEADDESAVCELESMIVDELLFEVVSFIM